MLRRNGVHRSAANWEVERLRVLIEAKGSTFGAKLRCLTIAAMVYYLWQERNRRVFQQKSSDLTGELLEVEEYIRFGSWKWRATRNFPNWVLCKEWGLNEHIVLR